MSTQYPTLDNRPINKWKVAELKEELKRRNLPTKGLKDDLVKRLDGAIRNERAAAEAKVRKAFDGESEHVGNFGDTKVESSSVQITNEVLEHGGSEVQKIDEAVTRVDIDDGPTKIYQGEALKQEGTVGTEPITIAGEPAVVEAPLAVSNIQYGVVLPHITSSEGGTLANKIIGQDNAVLESSQKDAVLVDEPVTLEATVQSIGEVVDSQVHQALDDKNIKTHNNEVEGIDFPPEKSVENIEVKPEDESLKSSQKGAVLVGESVTLEATVQSIGEVMDCQVYQTLEDKNIKICNNEVEETDLPPEKAAENIEVKPEDISLKSSQMDADRGEPYSSDQVYEVSHNLGLQVKSESFSNDALTVNEKNELKENLTADNVQLEPEIIRPEMVQPSSSRDPPGDGIVHPSDDPVPHGNQTLEGETDDDKPKNIEFSKKNDNADEMSVDVSVVEHNLENEATEKVEYDNELNQMSFVKDISPVSGLSPEQREPSAEEKTDVATSVEGRKPQVELDDNDFSKTTDGADGDLLEKVNLDQSSGDDSMEEDMSETRHVDSDHILSKVGEKTDSNKEPGIGEGVSIDVMQHITPSDKLESSNAHKDSGAALSEKRKFQDATEAENKEPPKRQRRWNTESQEVPESQSSGAILSPKPKASLLTASTKPNLTRSNSKLGGEAPKERVVLPSQKTPTISLRIDNFLRPFTLKAVQELLAKTGTVSSFWMDHIKTHCYVTYSSVEEAIETRNAVYNLQWPPNGGRHLVADFVDPEEVKLRVDTPSAAPSVNTSTSAVTAQAPSQPAVPTPQQVPRQHHEPQHPLSRQPPARDSSAMKEQLPRASSPVAEKTDPPIVTLDDLFRKTRATPRIYYLPLTDEQVAAKLARQRRDRL